MREIAAWVALVSSVGGLIRIAVSSWRSQETWVDETGRGNRLRVARVRRIRPSRRARTETAAELRAQRRLLRALERSRRK